MISLLSQRVSVKFFAIIKLHAKKEMFRRGSDQLISFLSKESLKFVICDLQNFFKDPPSAPKILIMKRTYKVNVQKITFKGCLLSCVID